MVLTFESVDDAQNVCDLSMLYLGSWLYKVVLSFTSVDEVFRCHRLTEYTDSY